MVNSTEILQKKRIKKLGDVCTFIGGGTPSKSNKSFWNGDIPWASIKDIKGKYLLQTSDFISKEGLKNSATNLVHPNEIILATRINPGRPIISKIMTAINQDLKIVRAKENVNTLYLYYAFLNYEREILKLSSGTTVKGITLNLLNDIEFAIPELKEQKKIVSKIEELFSDIDKGIEDLKIAQHQLKTYRQSVLKWAFEGKLTNEKVKEGELPKKWKWVKISDISKVVRGGSPRPAGDLKYYDGNIPFLKVADLTKDKGVYLTTFNYTIKEAGLHKTREISPKTLLLSNSGATLGVPKICMINATMNDGVAAFLNLDERSNHYLYYFWTSKTLELRGINMGAGQPNLNTDLIKEYQVPYCSFEEQHLIVQEIESRLSVADKMEETINESLKQAEALRQSILKKAFSGELVKETVQEKIHKPKNQYFFQMQIIGKVASISKKNNIEHGEMTIAKYTYMADKLFGIPTGFEFNRWHLGPYPPAIKKVINNKQYFQRSGNHIEVVNESTLFKSTNNYTVLIDDAVSSLVSVFSKYKTPAERAHKTELLATVCKVIEDIKKTDLMSVRASMKEWKISLKTSTFKNKAEKFNEDETKSCIGFIVAKGWDEKLI